uniref:Uncharacterized protein n=1 Tax=Timema douglasi TaxID=61478 RepID=A0A7R8VA46_TIMDO|nr:unnamed protein product [Timema douglasi]
MVFEEIPSDAESETEHNDEDNNDITSDDIDLVDLLTVDPSELGFVELESTTNQEATSVLVPPNQTNIDTSSMLSRPAQSPLPSTSAVLSAEFPIHLSQVSVIPAPPIRIPPHWTTWLQPLAEKVDAEEMCFVQHKAEATADILGLYYLRCPTLLGEPELFEEWVVKTRRELFPPENMTHKDEIIDCIQKIQEKQDLEMLRLLEGGQKS